MTNLKSHPSPAREDRSSNRIKKGAARSRRRPPRIVEKILDVRIPNRHGRLTFGAYRFQMPDGRTQEIYLIYVNVHASVVNVRINSPCFTGDIFGNNRCDCNWQLLETLRIIKDRRNGLVIYPLEHRGRSLGIVNELRYFGLLAEGKTPRDAANALGQNRDHRDFSACVAVLKDLGIGAVRIITNNPHKTAFLRRSGIRIIGRIPIVIPQDKHEDVRAANVARGHQFRGPK